MSLNKSLNQSSFVRMSTTENVLLNQTDPVLDKTLKKVCISTEEKKNNQACLHKCHLSVTYQQKVTSNSISVMQVPLWSHVFFNHTLKRYLCLN